MMTLEQRRKSLMALSEQQGHRGLLDVTSQAEAHQLYAEQYAELSGHYEQAVRDMRESDRELAAAQQRIADLEAQNERLRAALRYVEHRSADEQYDGIWWSSLCPACGWRTSHKRDCPVGLALAEA